MTAAATARPARATLVASLTEAPTASGDELRALSGRADCLEVRADLVGAVDAAWLRERFRGDLLFTYRSVAEGGQGPVDPAERAKLLSGCARGYDLVDLEAERDLTDDVLAAVPPERRVVSWHGAAPTVAVLDARLARASAVAARLYKLVVAAERSGDELVPLDLLLGAGRDDVVAFAMGGVGAWTRLIAPRLGAPWVYGAAGSLAAAPGQPSIERLWADYGLPRLATATRLFGVVGSPVAHSLSPRLHNRGYTSQEHPALYVAFDAPCFETFWRRVVQSDVLGRAGVPLQGLSVTTPHKESALAVAASADETARRTGGANTLLLRSSAPCGGPAWHAETTDPEGVVGPLRRRGVALGQRSAVVLGAGGAGRAAAAGLAAAGARVTLVNRTEETGRAAAQALGVSFVQFADFDAGAYDIVVNATSLGAAPHSDEALPCDPVALRPTAVAVELVYAGGPTPWSRELDARGIAVVAGREVLLHQGLAQFEAMTGRPLPFEVGACALGTSE